VRGIFEFRPQHLEHALDIAERIVVPNANCAVSEVAQHRVAFGVCNIVGMLAAIHFDDDAQLAANEVDEIRSDRLLPRELETPELPIAKMSPKHKFSARALPPQGAGALNQYRVWSTHTAPHPDPLPASGEREIVVNAPFNVWRIDFCGIWRPSPTKFAGQQTIPVA
jgi:hypothetical protein